VEFVDVPALVRGRGQDIALAPLANVDVLIHVVRVFEDESVSHPALGRSGRDKRDLDFELILATSLPSRSAPNVSKGLKKQKTPALLKEQAFSGARKPWLESKSRFAIWRWRGRKATGEGFCISFGEADALRRQHRRGSAGSVEARSAFQCGTGKNREHDHLRELEAEMAELPPDELKSSWRTMD